MVGSLRIACKFYGRHREVPTADGAFVDTSLSLDLQLDAENSVAINALAEGDELQVVAVDDDTLEERALGTFKFFRRLPLAGTESGLIVLELHR